MLESSVIVHCCLFVCVVGDEGNSWFFAQKCFKLIYLFSVYSKYDGSVTLFSYAISHLKLSYWEGIDAACSVNQTLLLENGFIKNIHKFTWKSECSLSILVFSVFVVLLNDAAFVFVVSIPMTTDKINENVKYLFCIVIVWYFISSLHYT